MADEESRLRRDVSTGLHDGAQQHLVMLIIVLQLLRQASEADHADVAGLLDEATEQAHLAIAGVRKVVSSVQPSTLASRGLIAAVQALAEGAPLPVEVSGPADHRFDPDVEMHAYVVIAEALTSAVERQASLVTVAIASTDARLTVDVSSDGSQPGVHHGIDRLIHIADRIAALEGTFAVSSSAEEATTLRATFPLTGDSSRE